MFYGIWGFFLKKNGYSSAKNRENTLQFCRQKIWENQITQKESIEFSDEIPTLKYNHNHICTNSYNIIIINKFCKPTTNNTLEIIHTNKFINHTKKVSHKFYLAKITQIVGNKEKITLP